MTVSFVSNIAAATPRVALHVLVGLPARQRLCRHPAVLERHDYLVEAGVERHQSVDRHELTPPDSIISMSYRADRR